MVGAASYLSEAIANALGQLNLTSLIDEVESPVPDLAVVLDVHSIGYSGHCQSSDGSKSSQDLHQASITERLSVCCSTC